MKPIYKATRELLLTAGYHMSHTSACGLTLTVDEEYVNDNSGKRVCLTVDCTIINNHTKDTATVRRIAVSTIASPEAIKFPSCADEFITMIFN